MGGWLVNRVASVRSMTAVKLRENSCTRPLFAWLMSVLRRLVEHNGPEHIDALDHRGRSVLWFAVANNHVRCVQVLLKHDAKLVDARGKYAEESAGCHPRPDRLCTLLDSRYGLPPPFPYLSRLSLMLQCEVRARVVSSAC
jgi:hypothetical protein